MFPCTPAPSQKPLKLRQMLEQYAEIGRLYLAPEGEAGAGRLHASAAGPNVVLHRGILGAS